MHVTTEKEFIPFYFNKFPKGKFLEIGSNDGDPGNPHEPCWPLLNLGWKGVYCEPNPYACAKLLTNLKPYRKHVTVVNSAITATGGLKTFYMNDFHHSCSSFQEDWMAKQTYIDEGTKQYSIGTNTSTMQQLVDYVGTDFNCISIDIECEDEILEEIIMSFDWTLFTQCKLYIIECPTKNISDYFESIGYPIVAKSIYNTMYGSVTYG